MIAVTAPGSYGKSNVNFCTGFRHPTMQCPITRYPVMKRFTMSNDTSLIELVKGSNTIETLCRETINFYFCMSFAISNSKRKCQLEYRNEQLSHTLIRQLTSSMRTMCLKNNIAKIRRNVDCIMKRDVQIAAAMCSLKNPGSDCTDKEFIKCSEQSIASKCGDEAGDVVTLTIDLVNCKDGKKRSYLKFL